jgi:catechol 2,3-dioxygenase-like lactoylglutathione lyase family enzyme
MFRFDGGFIMVEPERFEKGVDWYQKILGWKCMDQITSYVGRKAFMKLPRSGMVTIKSFEGEYDHFTAMETQGNVKLVFVTYDLNQTLKYLDEKNVTHTVINQLPNGQRYCDIFAFDHTPITIAEEPRGEDNNEYHPSGVVGFGTVNAILFVRNPALSASWYEQNLGFEIVEVNKAKGYAHLQTEDAYDRNVLNERFLDNIWLVQSSEIVETPNDNKARIYYDIRPDVFFEEYNNLIRSGIIPSEIAGDPINGWGGFHFYDPDNNRVNVWSYKVN